MKGKMAVTSFAGLVMAEEPARNPADLMSQLREYVKAQRASDPSFGKLKSTTAAPELTAGHPRLGWSEA